MCRSVLWFPPDTLIITCIHKPYICASISSAALEGVAYQHIKLLLIQVSFFFFEYKGNPVCSKWVLPVKNLVYQQPTSLGLICAKGKVITIQNLLLVKAFAELASYFE